MASQVLEVPERFADGMTSHTILHHFSDGCITCIITARLAADHQSGLIRQPRA
jgi:hypothetical protein